MKKFILSLVMMVSSIATFAQYEVGTFSIRPEVGLTASQVVMTVDNEDEFAYGESRYKAGFTAGIEMDYQIKKWMGISVGALYSQQGAEGKKGLDVKLNYDYITVPVLMNFYPCKGLCLKVGLQPAFNVNTKATEKGQALEGFGADNIRKFDMQLPVGISYETHGFIVDARYNFGLVNLLKKGGDEIRMNNSYATLTVGYKFHL